LTIEASKKVLDEFLIINPKQFALLQGSS